MEEKFTSSTQVLKNAEKRGFSNTAKKYIAAGLMAGNLMVANNPAHASQYTPEELATHARYIEEIKNHANSITTESHKALESDFEKGEISQSQYTAIKKHIKNYEQDILSNADKINSRITNIKDKHLIFMKTLPSQKDDNKTRIELHLNDISSLNQKQIESLEQKYYIDSVVLNRYYELNKNDPADKQFTYSPETYKKMLNTMDEKFGDLKNNTDLTDTEKATIVLKRMEEIKYDMPTLYLETGNMSNPKLHTSRSMEDPLLNKTGICAGYSDLFKNTMSYLGIESKEIRGILNNTINPNTLPGQANHVWNQVKLDGKWYNLDTTSISQDKNILTPGENHQTLFTSDAEFNHSRSNIIDKEYIPMYGLHEEAKFSLSKEKIDATLRKAEKYEEKRLEPNFLKRTSSKLKSLKDKLFNTKNKAVTHEEPTIQTAKITPSKISLEKKSFLSKISDNREYQKVTDNYLKTHPQEVTQQEHSKQNVQQEEQQYDDNERV